MSCFREAWSFVCHDITMANVIQTMKVLMISLKNHEDNERNRNDNNEYFNNDKVGTYQCEHSNNNNED